MKKKKLSKKASCKIHFKKRVQERLGLKINRHDIRELIDNILRKTSVISWEPKTNRVTRYNVIFKEKHCQIFFDEIRKVPITVLTNDMIKKP
jgi:hypothetical protein